MKNKNTAIARANALTQADGKMRWVNWTSLGWRIEFTPCIGVPSIRITFNSPKPLHPAIKQIAWRTN